MKLDCSWVYSGSVAARTELLPWTMTSSCGGNVNQVGDTSYVTSIFGNKMTYFSLDLVLRGWVGVAALRDSPCDTVLSFIHNLITSPTVMGLSPATRT